MIEDDANEDIGPDPVPKSPSLAPPMTSPEVTVPSKKPKPKLPPKAPILPAKILALHLHHPNEAKLPRIRPCDVTGASDTRRTFSDLKIHRILGCRKYLQPENLILASNNVSLLKGGGAIPPTLGDFATMPKQPQGKAINRFRTYLEKVHLDIVHGD